MKIASAKQKGRKLQQFVAKRILAMFPELTEDDARSTPMGCKGADVQLSQSAKEVFPFEVECKNAEGWKKLYNVMDQASSHGVLNSIAVIKSNRREALVVMSWDDFERLIRKQAPEMTEQQELDLEDPLQWKGD